MNAEPKQTPSKQKSLMKSLPKRRSSADRKPTPSPTSNNKIVARTSDRSFNIDSKENVDLALEINITTGPNVQVNFNSIFFFSLFWLVLLNLSTQIY